MSTTAPPMPSPTALDLVSIGRLACDLQRSTREVAHAAKCAGVDVAMRLNEVPYYHATDAERITRWFRENRGPSSPQNQATG